MATAKEHIDEIRRTKFSIGGDLNPLTEDLHQAVKNLSAELYAKDVHFLMELIQNAEDNEYSEGVDPSLEFIITSRDITATGAPSTLLIFNNEKGFSRRNIESICSVGRSTKKGYRKRGYIGEKGIGFKSVFLITSRPYIFSNGYQIRFHEDPCPHCSVGYIVPEWVDESPTLSDIRKIYGSAALPTTILVLPLKADKVKAVKHQLSNIHPQVLLFLTKIKRLSVREDNENPLLNTVNEIAISSETNFVQRKNIDAESFTLHLSAEENGGENECHYFMWKQKFPVRQENRVEKRQEVEEWVITLAFPGGEPLQRGTKSPGVYAFLPTEMVTNFPFIIQADFLLASSRETILLDNKWNQGILDCVPIAFVKAFETFVKAPGPISNLPRMFRFLPVNSSNYQQLNVVREAIKTKLIDEEIVPSETQLEQRFFHKPREVGRLMPAFWNILNKAREQGVSLLHLSSHGKYILSDSFDREEYDQILNFLGVEPVDSEWYAKCIQSSLLVEGVSEDVYLELLQFIADNWRSTFHCTNIKNIPLLKYENHDGGLSLGSINGSSTGGGESLIYLCLHSNDSNRITWLIDWNKEFRSVANCYFVPKVTQEAIRSYSKKETLTQWLKDHAKIGVLDVYDYAVMLRKSLNSERKALVSYVHLLYHSLKKLYLSSRQFDSLFGGTPLIDSYGYVISRRHGALVPAKGSKWAGLVVSNVWKGEEYIELSEDYLNASRLAGKVITKEKELIGFLSDQSKAHDIPFIPPPNSRIPAVSAPLTKENAFLLLKWIRKFRGSIPQTFLTCIKEGSWLKITLSGCPGSRPPSQSFMLSSSLGNVLQNQSVFVDIPLVDENYYGVEIKDYMEELKKIGVISEYGEACEFIGKHLISLAASNTLRRSNVISILNFIKFLRTNYLGADTFISNIKKGKWLRTSCGDRAPVEAVLYNKEWKAALEISVIPFIDVDHYGEEVCSFESELQLLGVVVAINGSHQLVVDHLKQPSRLTSLTADSLILLLQCMRRAESSERVAKALKGAKCLKTQAGFKSPDECVLCDPKWACLLQVFNGIPLIDESFYGSCIFSYRNELKQIGVVVDFKTATEVFTRFFEGRAKRSSISKENVMSFLDCCRVLNGNSHKFPTGLKSCIREKKWLRTRLGDYRSPRDCILFGPEWESISPISLLPFIDDSESYYGKKIHEYKKVLKSMGVVLDFKDGVKFVANRLHLKNPREISPANALALLGCIRILLEDKNFTFPEAFSKMVSEPWIKTHAGYRSPSQCLLFDSKCGLKPTDGPFIDETHYDFKMASYKKELSAIGVIVDIEKGCPLMFSQLDFLSETLTIVRIYEYLYQHNWKPESEAARRIWIPNGVRNGRWASPEECVMSDKSELFGLQLTVLDKYYTAPLLGFFTLAFQVKPSPFLDDYCKLWKFWETSDRVLSHDDCCKFWGYVIKHCNSKTEKTLAEELVKVPVSSGSDSIRLVNKHDAFIPDDLQLKELFEKSSSPHPIFVWYREPSVPSFPWTKLLEIFQRIGVRNISDSVQKEDLCLANVVKSEEHVTRDHFIGKGLLKLILGYLSNPTLAMEVEKRHKAVQRLLDLTVVETVEPIDVSYKLSMSSGKTLNVKASRMVLWEKESSVIFTQKIDRSKGPGNLIQHATCFSEVISQGVLWERSDNIDALSALLTSAFLLRFNKEVVSFLMKSKNLQTFMVDEDFLSSVFPSK